MHRAGWLVFAAMCGCAAQAQDFPCKLNDYRVMNPTTLVVLCDGSVVAPIGFSVSGSLFLIQDESLVRPAAQENVSGGVVTKTQWWLSFTFGKPLEGGKDYELQFEGSVTLPDAHTNPPSPHQQKFAKARLRFSTKSQATAGNLSANVFAIQSHVAVSPSSAAGAKLFQKQSGGTFQPVSSQLSALPVPQQLADLEDPEFIGSVRVQPAPPAGGSFRVDGLTDIFGNAVTVDPSKHAPPISVPKGKSDASYYLNFVHEAGWGIKPTWVADVKIAPTLGRMPGGFYWAPSFIANVGTGTAGDTRATDLINPSLGLTRLFRVNSAFEGVRITPAFSYETNRENDKRNAMFDGDTRLYFRGLSNTRAQRQLDEFLRRKPKEKDLQLDDVKVSTGYSVQFFLGTEVGSALTDAVAKSSDKSSQVAIPAYSIARLRPRAAATFEWKAVTFTVTTTPRYLFDAENVTRQTPILVGAATKQKIMLEKASGWQTYSEVGINVALDPAGHYAIGTTYKAGSQPPNFDSAHFFESGFIIRF